MRMRTVATAVVLGELVRRSAGFALGVLIVIALLWLVERIWRARRR